MVPYSALYGALFGLKMLGQTGNGPCPVAYLVLDFLAQFSKAFVVAVGDKQRVVAKARGAVLLFCYMPRYLTFKLILPAAQRIVAFHLYQTDDGAEACFPVRVVAKLTKQFLHVGFAVVISTFGVACRVYTRGPVQGIYLKSRIIGKAIQVIMVKDIFGFLVCIGF